MVQQAYAELPPKGINYAFISLMRCFNKTALIGGGNKYRLLHLKKDLLPKDVLGNIIPLQAVVPVIDVDVASSSDADDDDESGVDTATTAGVHLKAGSSDEDNSDDNKEVNSDSSFDEDSQGCISL